jgi:hypothetical protein
MDPSQLTTGALAAACQDEARRFQRREPTTGSHCIELFRRAVCDRDNAAWASVLAQYRAIVLAWLRRHPASASAREDEDYYVNRAFERFWMAVKPERFASFPDLGALLRYLKLCVHSVLLDEVRARAAAPSVSLDAPAQINAGPATGDVESQVVGGLAGRALWEAISQELHDDAERVVVYCSYALEMRPHEVYARFPERFAGGVSDVYRMKRNVLDRLRRSPRLREFLGS